MLALLLPSPLVAGAILLILGLYHKHRGLRVAGDTLVIAACVLAILQAHMVSDHTTFVKYGLFLHSWSDYLGFAVLVLTSGLLAGDALMQVFLKESYSSWFGNHNRSG